MRIRPCFPISPRMDSKGLIKYQLTNDKDLSKKCLNSAPAVNALTMPLVVFH